MKRAKFKATYPKLIQRKNGFWYIQYDRAKFESLGTKDPLLARRIFVDESTRMLNEKIIRLEKVQKISLQEYYDEYIKEREEVDDVAAGTLKNDTLALKKFIEAVGNIPLRLVTREKVNEFKSKLLKLGLQKTYINIILRSLRTAFSHAVRPVPGVREAYISNNPFTKQHKHDSVLYDLGEPLPAYFHQNEMQAYFNAIDRADFMLASNIYYLIGIRRSELVKLNVKDVDFASLSIRIKLPKNKGDRTAPITEDLLPMLSYYMRNCNKAACIALSNDIHPAMQKLHAMGLNRAADIGSLFPQWQNADTLSRLFQKYAQKAGIEGKLHGLRHTCATDLLNAGEDLKIVKEMLGHKRIETTEIYARVKSETLRRAGNKLKSPLSGGG